MFSSLPGEAIRGLFHSQLLQSSVSFMHSAFTVGEIALGLYEMQLEVLGMLKQEGPKINLKGEGGCHMFRGII